MNIPIAQYIKEIPEENIPDGLHEKILENIRLYKFKVKFTFAISVLATNFLFSLWVVFSKIGDSNIFSAFQYLLDGFEMNTAYLTDVANAFTQFIPMEYIIMLLANFFVMGYLIHISKKFKKLLLHSR
ncbi:MAG: hypothetical protein US74_C0019G0009 [Parcubacteria group bacterium GW2011_GWA2_38_13]|nr:MAG: hypothetical protein US74_C0019G0009 [Parcubacteria group bacterium GW2011_GWA2_38_13]